MAAFEHYPAGTSIERFQKYPQFVEIQRTVIKLCAPTITPLS